MKSTVSGQMAPTPRPTDVILPAICTLTDEQLRYKLAKILGWRCVNHDNWWHDDFGDGPPPDYPNDLNAVHKAEEQVLKSSRPWSSGCDHEPIQYAHKLAELTGTRWRQIVTKDNLGTSVYASPFEPIKALRATARQRSIALVLVLTEREAR